MRVESDDRLIRVDGPGPKGMNGATSRFTGIFGGAALALLASLSMAAAEPEFCRQLQAQYVSVDRAASPRSGDNFQLRRELSNLKLQASRNRCNGGFFLFGRRASPQCGAIMRRLSQVQREVNRSGGAWGSLGTNRSQAAATRNRIRNTLIDYGCEVPQSSTGSGWGFGGGGYRTVCVRTCDGYYFPISNSTGRNRFQLDEAVCRSMYFGREAELYIYPAGGDPGQAVSLKNKRYVMQPFAFNYRQEFNPACQAQLQDGLTALAKVMPRFVAKVGKKGKLVAIGKGKTPVDIPLPTLRPGAEDPETLANLAGGLVIEHSPAPSLEVAGIDGSAVRTIGPAYYYEAPVVIEFAKRPWTPDLSPPDFSLIGSAEAAEAPQEAHPPRDD